MKTNKKIWQIQSSEMSFRGPFQSSQQCGALINNLFDWTCIFLLAWVRLQTRKIDEWLMVRTFKCMSVCAPQTASDRTNLYQVDGRPWICPYIRLLVGEQICATVLCSYLPNDWVHSFVHFSFMLMGNFATSMDHSWIFTKFLAVLWSNRPVTNPHNNVVL